MRDKLIEAIDDILVDARVEEPAGRGAGYAIHYDEVALKKVWDGIMPHTFEWINKPCVVRGEDFEYAATCLLAFPKSNGKVRYIVEDNGRLFVQRGEQIKWRQDGDPMEPSQTIGEALELRHKRVFEGLGPKPEDTVTLAVLDDMDTELARMSKVTQEQFDPVVAEQRPSYETYKGCPHCGYFHPPDGMCVGLGQPSQEMVERERNERLHISPLEDPLGR